MSLSTGTATYVGENVRVDHYGHVCADESVVHIGNYCSIAKNVTFFVDGNHRMDLATTFPLGRIGVEGGTPCGWGRGAPRVGSDVWIGAGAVIMSGVSIGHGAVVAASSVVTKDVEPYAVVAGNPAVRKRGRFADEAVPRALLESEWWDLPESDVVATLSGLVDDPLAWARAALEKKNLKKIF
jgi:acetyltransferase-like isoleucine patch superfamily enzyme